MESPSDAPASKSVEHQSDAPGAPVPGGFRLLDGVVPGDRKGQARFYGAGEKTIKTWAKIGRDNSDPAPLADPPAMVQWWERLRGKGALKHRVPESLLNAAVKWATSNTAAPQENAESEGKSADSADDFSQFEGLEFSFSEAVKMAESNLQAHSKKLRDAHISGSPDQIRSAHSAYDRAFEIYERASMKKTKILADQGRVVDREEVRACIASAHAMIPPRLRASFRSLWRKLPDPRPEQGVWTAAIDGIVADCCAQLADALRATLIDHAA